MASTAQNPQTTTPDDATRERVSRLHAIDEPAAAGFYEGLAFPWPRAHGLALRRRYENMPVRVPKARCLIPCEPTPQPRDMQSDGVWTAEAYILDLNHHAGLVVHWSIVEEKKRRFPEHAAFIDEIAADLSGRLPHFGGYTHSNPDMRRVVGEGFLAMEHELDAEIAAVDAEGENADPAERNLLLALRDYSIGIRAFHRNTCAALRQAAEKALGERAVELHLVADSFDHGFMHPARNFLEGLLAVNLTWMLDGCDSIGRFDQALGALYERDLAGGAMTPEFARRLIDEVFENFERFNGWNMQIGGWTPEGEDGVNDLTRELIAACGRNHFRRPNVAFRVTSQTPEDALEAALSQLRLGSGRPALYNDDLYVRTLRSMDLGLTDADAREIGFGGCTETMIAGLSNCGSLEGDLSFAKALELALYDGLDPMTGKQAGPHTGRFEDFHTFEAFLDALRRQIGFMHDRFVLWAQDALTRRFTAGDPKLYRTFFTRDCVRRRKSFEAGGARYNWSVVSYQGIANLIDGLAAIRRCVFQEQSVSHAELIAALDANFEGREATRDRLKAAPKFGNDIDEVDLLGREIIEFAWRDLYSHEQPRGGRFLASCILFATYGWAGAQIGASPDGRARGEVLTDSVGPAQGRDVHGPTAMLRSVAKLPLHLAVGTPVLNIRFQRQTLDSPEGLRAAAALVRSFFAEGGMQIQFSVLDRERLLEAQREPEKHADLIVRIGGYSEYFTRLDRGLQDSVIARTEHGLEGGMS